MTSRTIRILAGTGLTMGMLAALAPAYAGTTWGPSQEVSSKKGRSMAVSDDGLVASWIRSSDEDTTGPVRTSYYRSNKKGWSSSAEVTGTVGSKAVRMSGDGGTLLIDVPGTGYLVADREDKNTWKPAQTLVSTMYVGSGEISADGDTVVYATIDDPQAYPVVPQPLLVRSRAADGSWNPALGIGTVPSNSYFGAADYSAISRDGSTVAFVDHTWALRSITKNPDGTWSMPVLLKQFTENPGIAELMLSADGTRIAWSYLYYDDDGLVTATRSGLTWSPLSYITADRIGVASLSPNGKVAAYTNTDRQVVRKTWDGVKWSSAKVMGTVSTVTADVSATNKTIAWDQGYGKPLYAVVYSNGKWGAATKLANTTRDQALNSKGRTVIWASTSSGKIFTKKR